MVETHKSKKYGLPFDGRYCVQSDPLADMLDAEKRDLGQRISKLESWLQDRNSLMYSNLSQLDDRECAVDSRMYWLRTAHPYEIKETQGIEKSLLDIEFHKHLERGSAFKDMWLVNKELIELVRQYQQLKRRDLILK